MQLKLTTDGDSKSQVYRPGDSLQGALEIQDCKPTSIKEVLATFSGCVVLSITPQGNGCSANRSKHVLFEQSKSIATSSICYEEHARVYPFAFQFPSSLGCSCRPKCLLPSSLDVSDKKMRIRAKYALHITVHYRLLGRVSRHKTVTRVFHFICNPIIPSMESSCCAALPTDKLNEATIVAPTIPNTIQQRAYLPAYSPTLRLEVILPQPPILIRGRGTPVQLILHTPPEVVQQADIYVRSIQMQLQTCAMATIRSSSQLLVHDCRGCLISGTIPVDADVLPLELGVFGKFTVFQSQPASISCLIQLQYSLNVTVGISKGMGPHIQYVTAYLDVVVMDPPPAYQPTT